jgi:hypothetical protein
MRPSAPAGAGPSAPAPAAGPGDADWMSDLRGDMMRNRPKTAMLPPEPPAPEPSSEWLSRIRAREQAESPQAAPPPESAPPPKFPPSPKGVKGKTSPVLAKPEPPAPPPAEENPREEEPVWLQRLRARRTQEDLSPPAAESAPEAGPTDASGLPDWLSRIRERAVDETGLGGEDQSYLSTPIQPPASEPTGPRTSFVPPSSPAEETFSPWGESSTAPIPPPTEPLVPKSENIPDWMNPPPAAHPSAGPPDKPSSMPDWLSPFAQQEPPAPAGPPPGTQPKPRESSPLRKPGGSKPLSRATPLLGPEWAAFTDSSASPPSPIPGSPAAFDAGMEPIVAPGGDEETPDWLADAQTGISPLPPTPARTPEPEPEEPPIPTPDIGELLRPDTMPDWMHRPEGAGAAGGEGAGQKATGQEGLEQAELPRWLEAMRPIQAVNVPTEEEERVESVGPLAGLRGVLSAEPVVAMPRRPGILAGNIDASPAQLSAADTLRRLLIEPEVRAARRAGRAMSWIPVLRRALALLLTLAVIFPLTGGIAIFSPPAALPPAGLTAGALVESLPTDRPVLAAFEYDASSAPELESGAAALLGHLARRNIPIAIISTQPNGATLAQGLINAGGVQGVGVPVVQRNLGYVAGGASGLRSLAHNMRDLLGVSDDDWQASGLSAVQGVGDFSMILVIAARPQTMRDWVEQVHTVAPDTPMIAVVSAASDALVYPYTQGSRPSIQGMIAGYAGAQAYGAKFLPGAATYSGSDLRWQAFGMGSLVTVLILIAGSAASLLAWGLRGSRRNME